ncbi:MAG TPA: GAF domain-containing protein [Terriglobales bacterium]|nr:GAF domain-containing protein [Terriglobales bacterium]
MASQTYPLSIFDDVPASGERRRSVRHKVHSPAYASFDGIAGGMVLDLTEILDISERGMCIRVKTALAINRNLNLVLDLPESRTYINAAGQVIWSDQTGRCGIRLSRLPDNSLRQLKSWLFLNTLTALAYSKGLQAEANLQTDAETDGAGRSASATVHADDVAAEAAPQLVADAPTLNAIRTDVVAAGPDLSRGLAIVAHRARALTRSAGAAIAVTDNNEMVCRASSGYAPPVGARIHVGSGFSGECVRTGTAQRCDDSESDPRVDRESCRSLGIRSIIAVPVLASNVTVGLIEVFSPDPNAFEEGDLVALRRLSALVAEALDRSSATAKAPAAAAPEEAGVASVPRGREHVLIGIAVVAIVIAFAVSLYVVLRRPNAPAQPQVATVPAPEPPKQLPPPATLDDLRRVAATGDAAAQFALGARYAQGDEVNQDYAEAVRWFQKAAEQGHVVAQATLGAYYWAGRGVPQDLSKAYFWSALARAGGDEASKYRVAALTSRMTRSQVVQAEQQANAWLREHQSSTQQ